MRWSWSMSYSNTPRCMTALMTLIAPNLARNCVLEYSREKVVECLTIHGSSRRGGTSGGSITSRLGDGMGIWRLSKMGSNVFPGRQPRSLLPLEFVHKVGFEFGGRFVLL